MTGPNEEMRRTEESETEESSPQNIDLFEQLPEIFDALPEEAKNDLASRVAIRVVRMERRYHKGPLPAPETLREYDEIVPGSAKQIMGQGKEQSTHRMKLESMAVEAAVANSKRGQWFGFIIAILVIASGVFLIYGDKDVAGLMLALPGLAALVGTFIYSQRRQREELGDKGRAFSEEQESPSEERSELEE